MATHVKLQNEEGSRWELAGGFDDEFGSGNDEGGRIWTRVGPPTNLPGERWDSDGATAWRYFDEEPEYE